MLSIFSIPKPFAGHSEIIQRNAIQSWLQLKPQCEIILCGTDQGVSEIAMEYDLIHIPDIESNDFGTPLLNSAFNKVRQVSKNNLTCYVNADIIILNSLIDAIRLVPFQHYLLLGQRWNMDITDLIDFDKLGWEEELKHVLNKRGQLQPPFGSDYFVFNKEIKWEMPEFAVGRPGWDNWLIYKARALNLPVVDGTKVVVAIHQNHDYSHVPKADDLSSFEGPEAVMNRDLMGSKSHAFNINDATHQLTQTSISKALDYKSLQYRISRQPTLNPSKGRLHKFYWRFLYAMLEYRKIFPKNHLETAIYNLTK